MTCRRVLGVSLAGFALVLAAICLPSDALAEMPPGDPARGRQLAHTCDVCHGTGGVALDDNLGNLAGQKTGYLEKQLLDMRSSANERAGVSLLRDLDQQQRANRYKLNRIKRGNEIMDTLVIDLSDQDIADLAAHFHRLPCGAKRQEKNIGTPREAVRCGACHGDAGVSRTTTIPNIASQPEAYLAKRLRQFRELGLKLSKKERRRNIMSNQARLLTEKDIQVLARHYSRLACR